MFLDRDPVLHIVYNVTKFSSVHFLADVSIYIIWKTMIAFWACFYTDLPNMILTNQGTQFGENFINLARLTDL